VLAPLDVLIRNTSEILAVGDLSLSPVPRGALGITGGRVAYLGPEDALPAEAVNPKTRVIDAHGGFVGPGFVDPHTHLVFAGDRSAEFELRCKGASYLEIAQAGGGIMSTVRATREATEDALFTSALPRLTRLLHQGVTTAEVKSGYGLDVDTELKMLRATRRLSEAQPIRLIPTLLCAHAIPAEYRDDREGYVRLCVEQILPAVAQAKLAEACDAFCEQGAFSVDETRRILRAAQALGFRTKLHADQLSAQGGASLAAELGALSADHLEFVDARGAAALASAQTSAVLVPTTTLFLRQRGFAPARLLRNAGVNVALGTNVNPGSAMSESVALTLGLGCLENGLTPTEAYWAMTRGAALALGLSDEGRLRLNGPADCVVFSCPSHRHLPYHLGINHAVVVVKAGRVVAEANRAFCSAA